MASCKEDNCFLTTKFKTVITLTVVIQPCSQAPGCLFFPQRDLEFGVREENKCLQRFLVAICRVLMVKRSVAVNLFYFLRRYFYFS